jgi:hypothetical protein
MTEQIELRPPEEVFNGDNLPTDLKWLMTSFNLPKNDPAVVLMAWHWKRVADMKDVIKNGQMELNAALETRIHKAEGFATTIQQVDTNLGKVAEALALTHLNLKAKIETEFKQPIADSLEKAVLVAATLEKLLQTIQTSGAEYNRKRWRAAYWSGWASGVLIMGCLCWLLFAH